MVQPSIKKEMLLFTDKIMKKIVLAISVLASLTVKAQDIHFSQYFESPLNLSPALAGTDYSSARANLNYRNQWSAFGKPYQTMAASFDMGLFKSSSRNSFLGAGLSVFQDKAGTAGLAKFNAAGSLSGVLQVSKASYFSVGIQGSYNQISVNTADIKWDAQFQNNSYNASIASGEVNGSQKTNLFDLGAGIAFVQHGNSSNLSSSDDFSMTIGAGAYHLNRPNQAFQGSDRMNMRYNGFAKFSFGVPNSNLAIQPHIAYWKQGNLQEINAGAMFRYILKPESQHTGFERGMALSFGGFYRVNDALYPMMAFEYGDYSIGISYDVNLSSLTPYSQSRGGFEISLRYRDLNGLVFGSSTTKRFL